MKKSLFLIPLLGLLSVSCSSDYLTEDVKETQKTEDKITGYLSIRLTTPGSMSTRDGESTDPTDTQEKAPGSYLDGSKDENYVSLVRFYFFDDNGNSVEVRKNPYEEGKFYAYYDWNPLDAENNTNDKDEQNTIEKIMKTVMVINQPVAKSGEAETPKPTRIVAVINPTTDVKNTTVSKLSDLQGLIKDFQTGCINKGGFVMSNSIYAETTGTASGDNGASAAAATNKNVVVAQRINPDENIASSIEEANAHPITVYVERVVARIDLVFDTTSPGTQLKAVEGEENLYDTGSSFDPIDDNTINEDKIYVRFLGWTVTSSPTNSYLLKQIDPNWDDNLFSQSKVEPWNAENYKRSFWAINPTVEQMNHKFYSYNEMTGGLQQGAKLGQRNGECYPMKQKTAYMQENAAVNGTDKMYPNKVIFAGQLVNGDGEPVEIAEYEARYYTVSGLKKVIAGLLDMWYYNEDAKEYQTISPDQLYFKTYSKVNPDEFNKDGETMYNVFFCLSNSASKLKWYNLVDETKEDPAERFKEISNPEQFLLNSTFPVKVWKKGMTYYYFEIEHLGDETGTDGIYGVVRNHIYQANINKLTGLGTPVYNPGRYGFDTDPDPSENPDLDPDDPNDPDPDDPDDPEPDPDPDDEDPDDPEPIYPEHPTKDGDYISATINILQWRLVNGNYQMSW